MSEQRTCPECGGMGVVDDPDYPDYDDGPAFTLGDTQEIECEACHGTGIEPTIPPASPDRSEPT